MFEKSRSNPSTWTRNIIALLGITPQIGIAWKSDITPTLKYNIEGKMYISIALAMVPIAQAIGNQDLPIIQNKTVIDQRISPGIRS
jgi:hypothetical protein